jgi:hypothetical protein
MRPLGSEVFNLPTRRAGVVRGADPACLAVVLP